ncbi:hypothetical protein LCGC14_2281540 [marine sediment metagenome]|uniref:Uncharacterized protein n=1 Tax=marine sediment metagenome TaxID=412755 RepID=A0A0F9F6I3_9ZZZZ
MIETIDEITSDDLFNALGDSDFISKLFEAADRRIKHHVDWLDHHTKTKRPECVSREYKKTKAYMDLKRGTLKLLG